MLSLGILLLYVGLSGLAVAGESDLGSTGPIP